MAKRRVQEDKIQFKLIINGKEVERRMKDIRKEYRLARKALDSMTEGSKEYYAQMKEVAKLKAIMDQHNQKIRESANEIRGARSSTQKFISTLTKYLPVLIAFFGIDRIKDWALAIIQGATAAELAGKKFDTVFDEATVTVEKFAKANANAMGLTIAQYKELATAAGDLLIPMGFQREAAAKLSSDLVNLSGALSEWSAGKTTATQVSEILTKALLGEREQLKSLGISITENDVKQRLLVQNQAELTGQALQQAKAMATLELIYEKSTDAQNAFANGSRSIARSQAIISARVKEVQARLVQTFLPAIQKTFSFLGKLAGASNSYSDQLERERLELNSLVIQITSLNQGNEQREKLIGKLNALYPDFLANIDQETLSNQELFKRLEEVNQAMINKIVVQKLDAKTQEKLNEAGDKGVSIAEKQTQLSNLLVKTSERFNIQLKQQGTLTEKAVALQVELNKGQKGAFNARKLAASRISSALSFQNDLQKEQNELQEEANKLSQEAAQKAKELGVALNLNQPTAAAGGNASSSAQTPAQKKAKEELAKAELEAQRQQLEARKLTEDLTIELMQAGLQKQIAVLRLAAKRKIETLTGTENKIAENTRLIQEKLNQDIEALILEDAEKQSQINQQQADQQAQQKQKAYKEQLANLKSKLDEENSLAVQQLYQDLENGKSREEAQAKFHETTYNSELSYLEAKLALQQLFGLSTVETEAEIARQRIEINRQRVDEEKAQDSERWAAMEENAGNTIQAIDALLKLQAAVQEKRRNKELADLEAEKERQLRIAGDNEAHKARIEEKFAKKRAQIEKEHAKQRKAMAMKQAALDIAGGIIKALATPPVPNFGRAALMGLLGGLQLLTMSQQQFAQGGILPTGPSHSQGGIALVNNQTGQMIGEIEGGEPILSKETYRNNKPLVDKLLYAGRNGGFAIYEQGGFAPDTTPSNTTIGEATPIDMSGVEGKLDILISIMLNPQFVLAIDERTADLIQTTQTDLNTRRSRTIS